ncbi:MAG: DUF5915 domain-containing protein, partial [Candidatus Zixiibacteriota bacterium]
SVHMTDFPAAEESLIDTKLEEQMALVEKIVSLGRAARAGKNLKVRQPLTRILVGMPKYVDREQVAQYFSIIKDELNIKDVVFSDELDQFVTYSARLNFKVAGPRLGADVKQVAALVNELESDTIRKFAQSRELIVNLKGRPVKLTSEELEVVKTEKEGFAVESDGPVTIALDTQLNEDLISEGFAREMVNKIQNMRKVSGFEVTDYITVRVHSSERLKAAALKHDEFIRRETLAHRIEFTDNESANGKEWNINGEKAAIAVAKA